MEIRYCEENEVANIIAEIGQEALHKGLKINVIPQFVGAMHTVYYFGSYVNREHFKTIILRPRA